MRHAEIRGIGPATAVQAIVSFSHAGRCRNDAAFAKLAETSSLEASSGQTTRYLLMLLLEIGCVAPMRLLAI